MSIGGNPTTLAILSSLRAHVEDTGHREFYGTSWPSDRRVGFTCSECENLEAANLAFKYEVWVPESSLPVDSEVWSLLGAAGHQKLRGWVQRVRRPNSWRFLLDE